MATQANQIDIPSSSNSLTEIEGEISAIHARRGSNLNLLISPGTLSKRRGAFHDAAMLQALITWARLSSDGQLKLTSRNQQTSKEDLLTESCEYSVGVAVLAMAPHIFVDGVEASRSESLKPALHRMDHAFEGNFEMLLKGRCVDLLCVSGANRQYLRPLFSRPEPTFVRDKFSLKATVRGLAVQAHPRAVDFLDENVLLALATLLHELFENTQDHAIKDLKEIPYRRHVEGLLVSWLHLTEDLVRDDFFQNSRLRDYWATLASIQKNREAVSGICFSFIDSGPGMAARLLGKDHFLMSKEEEREALLSCLRIRSTTKVEQGTGGGLTEVLTELKELHGLVRIRSGRLAIYKAFAPGLESLEPHEGFDNWFEEKKELGAVAGTVVSIFIPLPKA